VASHINNIGVNAMQYFVRDALGSTAALTGTSGNTLERDYYDPWGKRRNANGSADTSCALTSATTRGFSGHEMMDSVCMTNMNGRIYDQYLSRFASADTMVGDLGNGQSYNRYSYVNNRPTAYVDPTGHVSHKTASPGEPEDGSGTDPDDGSSSGDVGDDGDGSDPTNQSYTGPQEQNSGCNGEVCYNSGCAPGTDCLTITAGRCGGNSCGIPVSSIRGMGTGQGNNLTNNDRSQGPGNSPNDPNKQPSKSCKPADSTAAKIANALDDVSAAASGVALVSGGVALVTSETGIGAVTFGGVAAVAGAVSLGTSVLAAGFNIYAGRYGNAGVDIFSASFGTAAGMGAKSLRASVQLMREGMSDVISEAASSTCPG
jgi:RHS repeat-associated protein